MKMQRLLAALAGFLICGLFVGASAGTAPAQIPFSLYQGNIVVPVVLGDHPPLPFVFDSGLSHGNIITTQTAEKLGIKASGKVHLGDASGAGRSGGFTRIDHIRVGSVVLAKQPFAIVKVPSQVVARNGKPPIAGYIGAPLLKNAVVCVDYADKTLERWPRAAFKPQAYDKVPARVNHGLVTIYVIVDGLPAVVAIDTGNNGGVELFPAFVKAHHLLKRYPDMRAMKGASGAGNEFHMLGGTAGVVEFGPHTAVKNAALMFIAQSFDPAWRINGLVGYRALSRLDPCIDRAGGHVYFPEADAGSK